MKDAGYEKVMDLIGKMEKLADQIHVKARILDAISDCKEGWTKKMPEQERLKKIREVDDLFRQLEEQLAAGTQEDETKKEIRQRSRDILNRCRNENEILQKEYCGSAAAYIQEAERKLHDLANVRANYEEVVSGERFLRRAHNIGDIYKQQLDELQGQYTGAAGQNYTAAFDRLRSLFAGIGRDASANRRFYENYDENQNNFINLTEAYARGTDKGEKSIVAFAENVQEPLHKRIGRLRKKKNVRKLMPLIVLLVLVLAVTAVQMVQENLEKRQEQTEEQETAQVVSEQEAGRDIEGIVTIFTGLIEEGISGTVEAAVEQQISGAGMLVAAPILIICIFAYILWCRAADKLCRERIIRETGNFLQEELEGWERQKLLAKAVEKSFLDVGQYMSERYDKVLAKVMPSDHGPDGTKEELGRLRADWERLKQEVAQSK